MKKLIATLLVCLPVFGGQSFVTPAATSTNITWPTNFPALTNAYVEVGVDIIGNCTTAFGVNNVPNFVAVTLGTAAAHRFGFGCNGVGTKAISLAVDNGSVISNVVPDASMAGVTTAVFRQTRDATNNLRVFEAFKEDGTLIAPVYSSSYSYSAEAPYPRIHGHERHGSHPVGTDVHGQTVCVR
jgi:hypothetical protein